MYYFLNLIEGVFNSLILLNEIVVWCVTFADFREFLSNNVVTTFVSDTLVQIASIDTRTIITVGSVSSSIFAVLTLSIAVSKLIYPPEVQEQKIKLSESSIQEIKKQLVDTDITTNFISGFSSPEITNNLLLLFLLISTVFIIKIVNEFSNFVIGVLTSSDISTESIKLLKSALYRLQVATAFLFIVYLGSKYLSLGQSSSHSWIIGEVAMAIFSYLFAGGIGFVFRVKQWAALICKFGADKVLLPTLRYVWSGFIFFLGQYINLPSWIAINSFGVGMPLSFPSNSDFLPYLGLIFLLLYLIYLKVEENKELFPYFSKFLNKVENKTLDGEVELKKTKTKTK